MDIAHFDKEKELFAQGEKIIIGIDEVGRGPLAGPVVAAACVLRNHVDVECDPESGEWALVRDSKKLSENQRESVRNFIKEKFFIGVGQASAASIDRNNILQATFLAMKAALADLQDKNRQLDTSSALVLLDGNQYIPNSSARQECVIGGDKKVKTIAAASIVAKVVRDQLLYVYDKEYPEYGFGKHKGYGTKAHMQALQKYGATPYHRKSFRPVKEVL